MSLRWFHLVFIATSVVLAAFVCAWAAGQYRVDHETQYVVIGAAAILFGALLAVYGAAFQRKTKNL
jgi:uncharacterized membrane protein YidH (DUF202 family)